MSTTLAKELEKILTGSLHDYTIIGNKAYINNGNNKYAIYFSGNSRDSYDTIVISVANGTAGKYDENYIHFADVFGKLPTTNPNFPKGICLRLDREYNKDTFDYYVAKPYGENYNMYKTMAKLIDEYVDVFG